jgi:hypothetical protein
MTQRKPYNPNSKYGRKKLREQVYQSYSNMNAEQKANHNQLEWIITIIILIVVGGVIFLFGGSDALFNWAKS